MIEWADARRRLARRKLLVNTTSLGMAGNPPLDIALAGLPAGAAVCDIVYAPLETALLTAAQGARAIRVADGLGMLLHQARPGFAAWFGVLPEVTPELRARRAGGARSRLPPMMILGLTGSDRHGQEHRGGDAAAHGRAGASTPTPRSIACSAPGGAAVACVAKAFPGARKRGRDRPAQRWARRVFADRAALKRLEAILHPLVRAQEKRFLKTGARAAPAWRCSTSRCCTRPGGTRRCDAVAVIWAPGFLQRARVLSRPGMSRERLATILAQQLPIQRKRILADFAVPSGLGRAVTRRALVRCLERLRACGGESAGSRVEFMREIVLDTETTGLDPSDGHRIVEIACIELDNHLPTGRALPPLRQSRARHAGRGRWRCTG